GEGYPEEGERRTHREIDRERGAEMLATQLLALDEGGTESGLAEGVQNGQPGPGHSEQTEIARRQEGGEGEVDDHCRHLPADLLNHRPDHRRSATSRKRHSSWASVRS